MARQYTEEQKWFLYQKRYTFLLIVFCKNIKAGMNKVLSLLYKEKQQ